MSEEATFIPYASEAELQARAPANDSKIAVLIPCRNEEMTIEKVVTDFRLALPGASIYVYDNSSSDRTIERAVSAGAIVRSERLLGKGNVVRRMFADVEADIYVLVDGDDTYHAASCPKLIETLVDGQLDMVNGARSALDKSAYPRGHTAGNAAISGVVRAVFGKDIRDMLSGYRVLSRRLVKSFPALSAGFEIETELTVHALELRLPIAEASTPYKARPENSKSKIRTVHDGMRIIKMIFYLVKTERPLVFFSGIFATLSIISLLMACPVLLEFLDTGLVTRIPTAILATGIMLLSFMSLMCGLILDTITHGRRELKRMLYLSTPSTSRLSNFQGASKHSVMPPRRAAFSSALSN